MTPTEAINTLYYDDVDILHIDNWRFFTPKKRDRMIPQRQKLYHTYYAPLNIERWALPLFKSVGLVPNPVILLPGAKSSAQAQLEAVKFAPTI
jgi:hypothetical protein